MYIGKIKTNMEVSFAATKRIFSNWQLLLNKQYHLHLHRTGTVSSLQMDILFSLPRTEKSDTGRSSFYCRKLGWKVIKI
jgi:hypothetical protein